MWDGHGRDPEREREREREKGEEQCRYKGYIIEI